MGPSNLFCSPLLLYLKQKAQKKEMEAALKSKASRLIKGDKADAGSSKSTKKGEKDKKDKKDKKDSKKLEVKKEKSKSDKKKEADNRVSTNEKNVVYYIKFIYIYYSVIKILL